MQTRLEMSLPIDLTIEVLSRLPVKSIARCRCVSKLWGSIIRSPEFTDLVLTISATTRPKLLLSYKTNRDIYFYSLPQGPNEESSPIVASYHMSFPLTSWGASVLNSGHGLICLKHTDNRKGVIYNPSTGQSLTLPIVETGKSDVDSYFVYDQIGKQFKLLSMTISRETMISEEHQILTLGNGKLSWRMIECSVPHYHVSEGICINGVLYYEAKVKGFEGEFTIVCFDIRSEKFKTIKQGGKAVRGRLVNFKGKLATLTVDACHASYASYAAFSVGSRSFELCVLEDTEKQEWSTHIYKLPSLSPSTFQPSELCVSGVTRTGEIMLSPFDLSYPFYLVYYNLESKTFRKVEVQGLDVSHDGELYTFIDHIEDVKFGGVFETS